MQHHQLRDDNYKIVNLQRVQPSSYGRMREVTNGLERS